MAETLGLLALGVAFSTAAGSQTALLTGLRRLGDVAKVTILSAAVGSAAAVGALFLWGLEGVVWFVIAVPAAMAAIGAAFVLRLPRPARRRPRPSELVPQWRALIELGIAFSLASLASIGALLLVRVLVQRELGMEALGLFQASWVISVAYVGFVLQAMASDYYPRLTKKITDRAAVCRMVNEQTEVALFLSAPVLLLMLGGATWVMQFLYSSAFTGGAVLLRWQVLGDMIKVASWPLAYVLLASGRARAHLFTELFAAAMFVGCSAAALSIFGLKGAGIAYFAMYLTYLPIVFLLARRSIGFAWDWRVQRLLACLTGAATLTVVASDHDLVLGAATGLVFAAMFALAALLSMREALPAPVAALVGRFWGR